MYLTFSARYFFVFKLYSKGNKYYNLVQIPQITLANHLK